MGISWEYNGVNYSSIAMDCGNKVDPGIFLYPSGNCLGSIEKLRAPTCLKSFNQGSGVYPALSLYYCRNLTSGNFTVPSNLTTPPPTFPYASSINGAYQV